MSALVFSHEQDVDGIFSAAILKIAFPKSQIFLTNYGLEKMTALAATIESKVAEGARTIVIADIGVNEESYLPVLLALRHAKQKGCQSIWLDHHVWPVEPKKAIQETCELVLYSEKDGVKKCASELCVERFLSDDKLAAQLAAIAHRTDFPDSPKFPIPPLTALISYYLGFPGLRDRLDGVILESVVKGVLWDTRMQADVMDASRLIDESIAKSVSEMTSREFISNHFPGGIRVAIAKSDSFVNRSILLGRIMDESPVHVAIGFTDDGKVSIRKKEGAPSEIDCSKIALEFKEGGGHVGAAGGFLHSIPEKEGNAAATAEIVNAMESYLSKLN